jgi:hypothetical protein
MKRLQKYIDKQFDKDRLFYPIMIIIIIGLLTLPYHIFTHDFWHHGGCPI